MRKLFLLLLIMLLISATFLFFGFVIMCLWNWLMPTMFYLPNIDIWQALGFYTLVNILIAPEAQKKIFSLAKKKY